MEFKKFNAKEWRKYYCKVCNEMTTEELQEMYKGIVKLGSIFREYNKDKCGALKRHVDLYEYEHIAASTLLQKFKEEEEVPY